MVQSTIFVVTVLDLRELDSEPSTFPSDSPDCVFGS